VIVMAAVAQRTYSFSLILSGVSKLTPEMTDALFGAGCDDATPASCDGVVFVDFDREAESLGKAIGSAISDVERAGFSVSRIDVETSS
jgi:hypothetical protein